MYRIVVIFYALFGLLFSVSGFAAQEKPDPQTLVVHYTEMPDLIAGIDRIPSLHIYHDGTAKIYYPDYMRRAGHYIVHLKQDEMNQLYELLIDKNILAFDETVIRNQMSAIQQSQVQSSTVLSNTSDASKMTVTLFPGRFKLPGSHQFTQEKSVQVAWSGVKQAAQSYPKIAALQSLSRVQQFLSAVMQRSDSRKIDQ